MLKGWFSGALLVAVIATSCSDSGSSGAGPGGCVVGTSASCACPDGRTGAQTCKADRTFDACTCTGGIDGGPIVTDASSGGPCVPEADAAFCARLGKSCEMVTAPDSCGAPRSAECGTCSGTTPICTANVCAAPVCGANYGGSGTPITSLSVTAGRQQALLGASATGATLLYLEGITGCVGFGSTLLVADAASVALPTPPTYTKYDVTSNAGLGAFSKAEQTMTLSADGRTIIGADVTGTSFLTSTRTASGQTDFTNAVAGVFATLNGALPAGGLVAYPVQSVDGRAFYYQVVGATDPTMNGVYESLRAQPTAGYPAGQKMPPAVQMFGAITGISSDRMTLFVTASFTTSILTRTALTQPFAASATTPPAQSFRVTPVSTCSTLFGTCAPGGCGAETICLWAKR